MTFATRSGLVGIRPFSPPAVLVLGLGNGLNTAVFSVVNAILFRAKPVLVTSNYVVVETVAVAQRRLGVESVRAFVRELLPALDMRYVDDAAHAAALHALLVAGRRNLSFVDCSSFELMRREGMHRAYAYNPHFKEEGFVAET